MEDRTILHAKKIVTRTEEGWTLEINLLFDGSEFSLTEGIPIQIDDRDACDLIPGIDTSSAIAGQRYFDTIDIDDCYQFDNVFRTVLTDEANELLSDVYSARAWRAEILDQNGRIEICSSFLTDCFAEVVAPVVASMAPCWIKLSYAETTFDEWRINVGEWNEVYSDTYDGFAPKSAGQIMSIISGFAPSQRFLDKIEFHSPITKQGNSLVLKVTDQCRRLGVDVGDEVDVVISRSTPEDNTRLRLFSARRWTPIKDPDEICHRNGCDLNKVQRFLETFSIIGTVNPGNVLAGEVIRYGETSLLTLDHLNYFKTSSGENILVAQPYIRSLDMKFAEDWAKRNGCSVEEHRELSWHRPPETTLLIFRRNENSVWHLPSIQGGVND